jgi:SWI/SNF-related matrix-associated actin-dependent regulator 1 of chromatin subfamily A
MSVPDGISQGIRKGVLFFLGNEFTIQFDSAFMRSHNAEYQVFVELTKKLKQRKFDDRKSAWNIPVAQDAVRQLQEFLTWGIQPTKEAREKLSAELKKLAQIDAVNQEATEEVVELTIPGPNDALNKALKNYQKAGVKYLSTVERAYLADDMGLGKSVQILATFELKQAYPALIVCPVKLKQNWIKECKRWLPHRTASMQAKRLAEITVLGYSEIHEYVNYLALSSKKAERDAGLLAQKSKRFFIPTMRRYEGIALDEAHWIKNGAESRRGLACIAAALACNSRIRIAASGTPIENGRPSELIAPLKFLGQLEAMGGWHFYVTRYCAAKRTRFGFDTKGASNTKELYEKLSRVCYIRRRKQDVLKELPAKIPTIYEAEISNWDEYRRIERDVVACMMEGKGRLLTREESDAKQLTKLSLLRRAAGMGKVDWIIDWVNNFLESGEKFVLYATSQDVQAALVRGLAQWSPAVVLGGCTDVQAQEDKFMKDERCRLFIGSVKAAGFGLTLTAASHIGLAELEWTDSKHQQVFDRCHRIGQKECVNCYYFIAPDTIDEHMMAIVSAKAQINSSAVDGEDEAKESVLASLMRKSREQAA